MMCARIALFIAVAMVCVLPAEAARGRRKDSKAEMRFRLTGIYGRVDYQSMSRSTNALTTFDGYQFGARADIEGWVNRRLGVLVDGSYMNAELLDQVERFRGKPIVHTTASASLGFRLLGQGGTMNSESIIFAGVGLQNFSEVRAYTGQNFYDLTRPHVLGAKLGARWRWHLFERWVLEGSGYWFAPYTILKEGRDALSASGSYGVGGLGAIEREIIPGVNGGLGFNYEKSHLEYVPRSTSRVQVIDFTITSTVFFIRFWF